MLNQYLKAFSGFFGRLPENTSSIRRGNTPRSGKFSTGRFQFSTFSTKTDADRFNFSTKTDTDKSEIFGTGGQWGTVDSTVEGRGNVLRTESQENMVGDQAIHRTVDVEMWHTDGRSDESVKM
jgi:hypothetical protein